MNPEKTQPWRDVFRCCALYNYMHYTSTCALYSIIQAHARALYSIIQARAWMLCKHMHNYVHTGNKMVGSHKVLSSRLLKTWVGRGQLKTQHIYYCKGATPLTPISMTLTWDPTCQHETLLASIRPINMRSHVTSNQDPTSFMCKRDLTS